MELKQYGEKLKTARLAKGLTLEEVAQKMENGVTKQAVSQYENGKIKPTPFNELMMCLIYDIKKESLYKTAAEITDISKVQILSGANLRRKDNGILSSAILQTVNDTNILFSDIGIMPFYPLSSFILPYLPPLPQDEEEYKNFTSGNKKIKTSIYEDAKIIRSLFGLNSMEPVACVTDLIEQTGIILVPCQLPDFESAAGYCADIPFIAYNPSLSNSCKRCSLIEECLHLILMQNGYKGNSDNPFYKKTTSYFCTLCAQNFLFPKEAVERTMLLTTSRMSRHHIHDCEYSYILKTFGLTPKMMLEKLLIDGIIPRALYYESIARCKEKESIFTISDFEKEEKATLFTRCLECCKAEGIMIPSGISAIDESQQEVE